MTNSFENVLNGQRATDRLVTDGTEHLSAGQRVTDGRVSDGVEGLSRQINQDAMYLDAQADRNSQFNARNISDLSRQTDTGFLGAARGQAATDRNVDANARHIADGQRSTDANVNSNTRWLGNAVEDVDRDVNSGVRHLDNGQRHTDDQVDANARWLDHGQREVDRNVDGSTRWLGGQVNEVDRDVKDGSLNTERGQRLSDDRTSDGFYRTARDIDGNTRYLHDGQDANAKWLYSSVDDGRRETTQGFGHTNDHLSNAERRIEERVIASGDAGQERTAHAERRLHVRADDAERRTDNRIDAAERRIEGTTRHGYEELARESGAADRRNEVRLTGLEHDVHLEAQLTRDAGQRGELETRLYLRDREDRTEDLVRQLADRNLFEMQAFERRDRDDHDRTRALINHKDDLRAERQLIRDTALETQLRTKIDILEARRGCGDRDPGRDREVYRYDPRININLTDLVEDEARAGAAAFNRFSRDRRFDHNFNGSGNDDGNIG